MRVLLLQTGSVLEEIRRARGDFDHLFASHLPAGAVLHRVNVQQKSAPSPDAFNAVLISGSPAMVTDNAPWSLAVEDWIRQHVEKQPMLGVCYGHQLVARALGGTVSNNPNGRQIGTHTVVRLCSEQDDLFTSMPQRFSAQTTHVQSVIKLPPGARLLAQTTLDPHHAFRWGKQTWGVQFHPEFDAEITRAYLNNRRETLLQEGLDVNTLLHHAHESPHASALLQTFFRLASQQGAAS